MQGPSESVDMPTQAEGEAVTPPKDEDQDKIDHDNHAALFGAPTGLEAIVLATDDASSTLGMHESSPGFLSLSPLGHRLKMVDLAANVPPLEERTPPQPQPRRSLLVGVVADDVSRFYRIFGGLGVPMLIVFLLSAAWTFMLAVIQVYTTEVANSLMDTASFDYGNFWLLPKPHRTLVGCSVAVLVLFGFGYVALAVLMLYFSCRSVPKLRRETHTKPGTSVDKVAPVSHHDKPTAVKLGSQKTGRAVFEFVRNLAMITGEKREYMNAVLDLPKLIFQTTTLITYLRLGFPLPLVYFYLFMLLGNWLASFYRYQRYRVDRFLIVPRLFYMFDLFFAVFATLVVLVYFVNTFQFDRAVFATRQEAFTNSVFERTARLFGDPALISSFRSAFHYLQFSSVSSLLIKSALNVLSLYKWRKIIVTLAHTFELETAHSHRAEHDQRIHQPDRRSQSHGSIADRAERSTGSVSEFTKAVTQRVRHEFGKRTLSKVLLASVFLVAGSAVLVYALVAITSTTRLCSKFEQCGVVSYQWNLGWDHCICLMFVERRPGPATFAEWENPKDATAELSDLAFAGELRIVQVINRALSELPDALRRCHHLEQLILMYTKTTALPGWMKGFSYMEYIHIEADYTNRTLQSIPTDAFSGMPHLVFLRLGGMAGVPALPSFAKLHSLQSLALTGLFSLTALSDLHGLDHLRSLSIVDALHVPVLPSFQPLHKLEKMELTKRNAVCCNGFVTGKCDLTDFQCLPRPDEPNVTCTLERMPEIDKDKLAGIGATVCTKNLTVDNKQLQPTAYLTDGLCSGIMYRQCAIDGVVGICFSTRLQVISCTTNPEYIKFRRLQIERGVGDACDPTVETWLGCPSSS